MVLVFLLLTLTCNCHLGYLLISAFIFNLAQLEMMNELQSLPVSRDTVQVKTRQGLLERKLQEVDTALKLFSRPRVFIKDD